MRYAVLGSILVEHEACFVPLTRPKSRAVLGLLLARANQVVTTDQLVDDLWLGRPPTTAYGALRVHIAHLRRALPGEGAASRALESVASGYRMHVAPGDLDALRFARAISDAREAADAGCPRDVVELVGRGLELWRGRAYAELRDFPTIAAEAVRLEDLRLTAIELLADATLALDRPERACELLMPEVNRNHLREGMAERLMLALYRCGRGSEALRVYSRLREALDDELGVSPSASIRTLEESIVVQSPRLELPRGPRRTDATFIRGTLPVVGRRSELAAISEAFADLEDGKPRLVLIAGPAGIGKTTLAELAARRAEDAGARVLISGCEPEPTSDCAPFPQLIRTALAYAADDTLASAVVGDLVSLVPEAAVFSAQRPESDPGAGRNRLFNAVSTLLASLASAPLFLVLEDVHWATQDALSMLRHVLRETRHGVVVLTYRDDEIGGDTPLGVALGEGLLGHPDLTIRLDGLIPELQSLVSVAAPENVRDRLLDALGELHDLTAGNPLFVREVLQTVADEPGMNTPLDTIAPGGVRALVEARLQQLPAATRGALATAAVLGRRFSLRVLAATLGESEGEVLDAVEGGLTCGLICEDPSFDVFAFRHPLVRNAIYTASSVSRRARLHLRCAEALLNEYGLESIGHAAEMAHHFMMSLPFGEVATAVQHARRAGDHARSCFAYEEAVSWYQRAAQLADEAALPGEVRASLFLALGEALEALGRRADARASFLSGAAHARAAAEHDLLADIAIAATPRYVTIDGFHPTQLALVDEALACEGRSERQLAWLLSGASAARYYESGDEPYARRAHALARCSTDPEARVAGLLTYHRWLTHDPGSVSERVALSRDLLQVSESNRLEPFIGRAHRTLLIDLMAAGQFDEFDDQIAEYTASAQRQRVPADMYWASAFAACRRLTIGPWAETEELISAAHMIGRHHEQGDAEGTFLLQMFALRFQQSRTREIAASLKAPSDEQPRISAGLALAAAALADSGRHAEAAGLLERLVTAEGLGLAPDNLWLGATALLAGVAATVGTPAQRDVVEQALLPYASNWCIFGAGAAIFGTGHHWLAKLAAARGDVIESQRRLEAAAAAARAAGACYWAEVAGTVVS
jgi:DNA-binding SARP family transcriptional activator